METIVKNQDYHELYIENARNQLVVKANNIIQNAKFVLTEQEQNIIMYLISKIKPDDIEFKEEVFNINDFCKIAGITDAGNNYKEVKDTILNLSKKRVWVKTSETRIETLAWIDKAALDYGNNTLITKLSDTMKPYLLQLQDKFTQYQLQYTLSLKSRYSKRIYEFIKSYLFRGKVTIEIETLKDMLMCLNYKTWQDFKTRVIEMAQREINECSDLNFTYSVLKQGRKFTHIEFVITEKTDLLSNLTAEQKRKERLDGNPSNSNNTVYS